MTTNQPRISLNPQDPVQDKDVTICYDFNGSGLTQTTLEVSFSPGSDTADYTVTADNPCVTIHVPANATSIIVTDQSGVSPPESAEVRPW